MVLRGEPRPAMKRPFGQQVLLGIGGMLALLIGIAVMAIALVVNLHGRESSVNSHDDVFLTSTQSAALGAKGIANDQRGFLLTGDEQFTAEAASRVAAVHSDLARAKAAAVTTDELIAIGAAQRGFDLWIDRLGAETDTFRGGDHDGAIAASMGADRELRKAYEASLADAQSAGARHLQVDDSSVAAAASRTVQLLVVGLALALVIGVGIGEWLLRTIIRPVRHLVELLSHEAGLRGSTSP